MTPPIVLAAAAALAVQAPAPARLQHALDSIRAEMDARGVSASLIFSDGSTWNGVSGEAYAGVPVAPETAFEIGSITKTFTAALALTLVRDGRLDLDATVARWLPGLPHADRITVRQLLSHTSGVDDVFTDPGYLPRILGNPGRVWTAAEILALVGDPDFAPGERWQYSSSGFVAVGVILEAVTGRPLAELFRTHVFGPLGMTRTVYGGIEPVPEPRAHAFHDFDNDGTANDLSVLMPATALLTSAGAAGALVSTAAELARGLRALGTGEFLGEAQFRAFTTFVDRPDGNRYGLGLLRIELDGLELIGHRGNTAGFSAEAWYLPARSVAIAVLTNKHGVVATPFVSALLRAAER